ncbi:Uncharacterised protein [Mycobacteroides abscessus subsp. abscessus]|nr:Uncharacterised protein [Mycobacteroides abscessus subsp. abscessus]
MNTSTNLSETTERCLLPNMGARTKGCMGSGTR